MLYASRNIFPEIHEDQLQIDLGDNFWNKESFFVIKFEGIKITPIKGVIIQKKS